MCAFCAVFSGIPHWTETGTNAGESERVSGGRDWRLQRNGRVALVNKILEFYGCKVADWMTENYVVNSLRGRSEIVNYLPQIWTTVENIAQKPTDPLDPELLDFLRAKISVQPTP
ncbi:MAG: hypothetical protein EXQ98_05065 [Alphaproteobacteria bacterium]|nr:hypothetical protein [Alphaproteobacteria bacterium]